MNNVYDNLSWFFRLWSDNANWSFIQALCIGLFFFLSNFAFCFATHFVQKEAMIEYGYPGVKKKTLKKRTEKHGIFDRVTLFALFRGAKRKGFLLILCLICNMLSVIAAIVELVGYISCIISGGIGWSLTLLMLPGFVVFAFTALMEALPFLIFLPSEANRYKR